MPPTYLGKARWIVAGVVFIATTLVVLASYLPSSGVASCHDELANNSTILRVCGPVGVQDAVVIGLTLGFAALLIWPDLSELDIGGVFRLKKAVEEQEQKRKKVEADVLSLTLAQEPPGAKEVVEATEQVGRFTADAVLAPRSSEARELSEERAKGEAQFLEVSQYLDAFLSAIAASPQGDSLLRDWLRRNDPQLRTWATLRNQAVHFPERLSDEQIRLGLNLARVLNRELSSYLRDKSSS